MNVMQAHHSLVHPPCSGESDLRMRFPPFVVLALIPACIATTAPGPRVAAPPVATACSTEGRWLNTTPDVGQSTITVVRQPDGRLTATEAGMASFDGVATVDGAVLRIDFKTASGHAGWYEWSLDSSCNAGSGRLVFTAGGQGEHASSIARAL
jgi:hypothetical protein